MPGSYQLDMELEIRQWESRYNTFGWNLIQKPKEAAAWERRVPHADEG